MPSTSFNKRTHLPNAFTFCQAKLRSRNAREKNPFTICRVFLVHSFVTGLVPDRSRRKNRDEQANGMRRNPLICYLDVVLDTSIHSCATKVIF